MGLYEERIQQAEEALEISKQLSDISAQAQCLGNLAWLLFDGKQLNDAEKAASDAIKLLPEEGEQFLTYRCH